VISNLCKCIVLQLFIQYEAVWSQQKRVLFYFRTVQFLSLKIPLCKIGQLINEFQSNTHYLNGEWRTSSLGPTISYVLSDVTELLLSSKRLMIGCTTLMFTSPRLSHHLFNMWLLSMTFSPPNSLTSSSHMGLPVYSPPVRALSET